MSKVHMFVCALLITRCVAAQDTARSADEQAVRAAVTAYVDAFNAHDADALAALWEPGAIYVDRNTGERLEGREAIQKDFAALFGGQPKVSLTGKVDTVDFVTDDVATAEGRAAVFLPDNEPNETSFTATLVRHGKNWLIHSVRESDVAVPPSAHKALEQLVWLLGDWVDHSGPMRVDTSVKWSPGEAFLIRSFVVQDADGPVQQGTQVIGWDPRSHEIRSWTFNSDGSFGDGVWTKTGDNWLVQSTQTLSDGAAASGTYVITPVDEDAMTIQLVDHEIDGQPQPASETVTVVRAGSEQAATESTGAANGSTGGANGSTGGEK